MKINYKRIICLSLSLNLFGCSFLQTEQKPNIISQATPAMVDDAAKLKSEYTAYEAQVAQSADANTEIVSSKPMPLSSLGATRKGSEGSGQAQINYEKKIAFGHMNQNLILRSAPLNTESYDHQEENSFFKSLARPLSTFSIDVDTASYSNMRRMLNQNVVPPSDSIRTEELINYFDYDYAPPEKDAFSVGLEMAPALWNKKNKIVRIAIKGKEIKVDQRPSSNLVFLIDVSGSMESPEKLPLVKSALTMLADKMNEKDKISIVVYAGAAGLVLPPTTGDQKMKIIRALDQLQAGGSTNGSGGIDLAYRTASEQFIKGGVNRVILATDGDFNVGTTNREDLVKLVQKNAKKNIYLSILGFGMGNYKDGMMEALSNKGNGNYAYIDTQAEARKVMVEQLSGTLVTIAKDVKIQVEFNPRFVESYRLVGYENRIMKDEDFNNDKKDAGDIGAGHTVTALYEVVPAGTTSSKPVVDALKYQKEKEVAADFKSDSKEWMTIKLRYKKPDGDISSKIELSLAPSEQTFSQASESFRFASSIALFAMLLKKSEFVEEGTYKDVISTAKKAKGSDKNSYRQEFIELVEKAQKLKDMNLGSQAAIED